MRIKTMILISLLLTGIIALSYGEKGKVEPKTPIEKATIYVVCDMLDTRRVRDEVISAQADVVLRGIFKWSSDRDSWQKIAPHIESLHRLGIIVLGGITASSFFKNQDGTSDEQYYDFVTRNARNEVVVLHPHPPDGAHYAINNPKVIEYLIKHMKKQVDAGVDGFHIDEPWVIGAPWWNSGNEGYDDYAINSFRDFLKEKYPEYTSEDWKTKFDIDDIDSFNYREYLKARGWDENPSQYYSINPLGPEWEDKSAWWSPKFYSTVWTRMYSKDNFHGWSTRRYLEGIIQGINSYAKEKGKRLYNAVNGISPYVDLQNRGILWPGKFTNSLIPWFYYQIDSSKKLLNKDVPVVVFIDWAIPQDWYMELSVEERNDFIRIYSAEAYASGAFFAFHIKGYKSEARTNGTLSTIIHLTSWFKKHSDLFHDSERSVKEDQVKLNRSRISKTLREQREHQRLLLHLINHNYSHREKNMKEQREVEVTLPLDDRPKGIYVLSPDLAEKTNLDFTFSNGNLSFTIPVLKYYNVVVILR